MNIILGLMLLVQFFEFGSCFTLRKNSTDSKTAIIGGYKLLQSGVPYHVLLKCDNMYFCGGALISTKHVLTAAHCITEKSPTCNDIIVTAGTNYKGQGGVDILATDVFIHPNFDRGATNQHDIAVIKLRFPVTISAQIYPIYLPYIASRHGDVAQVTGFGESNYFNELSSEAKLLKFHLVDYRHCDLVLRMSAPHMVVGQEDICDDLPTGHGVCFGDSGSPLVDAGMNYVIGVVSRGVSCAGGYPNVYTSTYHHLNFIYNSMKL